jgi:hypothetical protein
LTATGLKKEASTVRIAIAIKTGSAVIFAADSKAR